ncbi:MAG: hypothetical protein LBD41_06895, partial [Clostridiales Family XIII bacterium]|nr:hypothetical protein [Clostridiales Family XIII bacterium]
DLIDASDSARTYAISGGIIFKTGLMNHDRPYFSGYENLYFSSNDYNGFNGQGGRYLVSDKILSDYALRKIQLYGQEISSGMFSLGRGMGNFQNITGVVTTLSGSTFNTGETLSISGYIDNADGKFVINKFDLDDGEW